MELPPRALAGCLSALGAEWLGAALGLSLDARLALALCTATAVGGRGLLGAALEPGRPDARQRQVLGLLALVALSLPSVLLAGPLPAWTAARLPPAGGLATWITVALSGPITEELLHRGLIQRGLSRCWGAGPAVLLSAGGFTAAHALAGAGAGPQHFAAGLVLAVAAERSGGWWAPALLHAAGNAGWLLAALL